MTTIEWGPTLPLSRQLHAAKYRSEGETFYDGVIRFANATKDSEDHFHRVKEILRAMRFLGGGRTQAAMGSPRTVTAFNCFVMNTIPDSLDGIMQILHEAALTMKQGGGVGYDFSTLRPHLDLIASLDSPSSGPLTFMDMFDAMCRCIMSAGMRRGAMMACLRVDHPDIEAFIRAKNNITRLNNFNTSVLMTDKFMRAVEDDKPFNLQFNGKVYKTIDARALFNQIMTSTWEYAEPGVIFIDTVNRMNNLHYCETIAATNPCGEQPLPPFGACLLGSFNLANYVETDLSDQRFINVARLLMDVPHIVRAMDNIIDRTIYPLIEQEMEARSKRRMGLGLTGVANAIEALGYPYGSGAFCKELWGIQSMFTTACYNASVDLAIEKGPFPLFQRDEYLNSAFIKRALPSELQERIHSHGIRNSHLISIAPTGTISLTADNVSSGLEPALALRADRIVQYVEGPRTEEVVDYGHRVFGTRSRVAAECTADDHLSVLEAVQSYVDSSISKTVNVDPDMPWSDFSALYMRAWKSQLKGLTTFNPQGKRFGVLTSKDETSISSGEEGAACYLDPSTGLKSCE